ncbi:MAG: hypothetical protein WCQ77_08150 [Planctomycetota bacterium]
MKSNPIGMTVSGATSSGNGISRTISSNSGIPTYPTTASLAPTPNSSTSTPYRHTGGRGGRGGDLLWRDGNLASWNAGTRANEQLYFQHNAYWIAPGLPGAGNILVLNNGWFRNTGGSFSSVMEIKPGGYGRAQLVWNSAAHPTTSFFSAIISGAQRLPNGNTLIDEGGDRSHL